MNESDQDPQINLIVYRYCVYLFNRGVKNFLQPILSTKDIHYILIGSNYNQLIFRTFEVNILSAMCMKKAKA